MEIIAQKKTSVMTFTGFPFVMVTLWEFDQELCADTSFDMLHSGLTLVHQEHCLTDQADQELALVVQSVYTIAEQRGGLDHAATFTAPGPFTALRTGVALLDGLHVLTSFQAHYCNLFDILFSKKYARNQVLWAVDNGRQSWCVGYMMPRKVTNELVLEVREDVSQGSLEKFHIHCQENEAKNGPWEMNLFWKHTAVEDVIEVLKKFAVSILYDEVTLKQKMKAFDEKTAHGM